MRWAIKLVWLCACSLLLCAWSSRAAAASRTDAVACRARGWSIVAAELPSVVVAGSSWNGTLTLRNDGCTSWSPLAGDRLSYHVYDADGRLVLFEGKRSELAKSVAPGATTVVRVAADTPDVVGPMLWQWELVREHVHWYGPTLAGADLRPVSIEPAELEWSLLEHTTPATLHAGEHVNIRVRVRNEGTDVWVAEGGDRFAYHWRDAKGKVIVRDGLRTQLPHAVLPGEIVELQARVDVPAQTGNYVLVWEPVRERVRWYGRPRQGRAHVSVTIAPPRLAWSLLEIDEPSRLWVGKTTTIPIVVRNEGTETWEPKTDHFSYHFREVVGDAGVVEGIRTKLTRRVAPGESIALDLRVQAPSEAGERRLVIGGVREHVAWFETPGAASPRSADLGAITIAWKSSYYAWAFALGTALLGSLLWFRRFSLRTATVIGAVVPCVWLVVAAIVLAHALADMAGVGAWQAHRTVAWSGACLVALPVAIVPLAWKHWLAAALALVASLLVLADTVYLHFFGSLVPVASLAATHQLGDLQSSIVAVLEDRPLQMLWVSVAAVVFAVAGRPRVIQTPPDGAPRRAAARRWRAAAIATSVAVVSAGSVPCVMALTSAMRGSLGRRVFSQEDNVGRFGLWGAHLFENLLWIRELQRPHELDARELAATVAYFDARAEARARLPRVEKPALEANVLLIQVEAFQQWVVGARVAGNEVTPTLNRWREQGLYFPYVFDQTSQGRTSDAEYLALAAQLPLPDGALSFLRADNHFFTLAHLLAAHGYSTFSAHPYERGFWNRAALHPRYGFARSMFDRELGRGRTVGWGLSDDDFFRNVMPTIASLPQPFFAFLITLGLHHPFDSFPSSLATLDVGELTGTRLGNYLQAMRFFDESLTRLLQQLEGAGLLDRTVIVVYGDHDAGLFDRIDPGGLGSPSIDLTGGGLSLLAVEGRGTVMERTLLERVPLFVRMPNRSLRGEVATVGGQVDIAPTIAALVGVDIPRGFLGQPLYPERAGSVVLPSGAALDAHVVHLGNHATPGAACHARASYRALPGEDCRRIAEEAAAASLHSRNVIDFDLYSTLSQR